MVSEDSDEGVPLESLLSDLSKWPHMSYGGEGSGEPNLFAYVPKPLVQLVVERAVAGLKSLSAHYVFGWVDGRDVEVLQESDAYVPSETLSYLKHGHDGCRDCSLKADNVDSLADRLNKEQFGADGMRNRLAIYLESRHPDDLSGSYPFILRLHATGKDAPRAIERVHSPDFHTIEFLVSLYGKALYLGVECKNVTPEPKDENAPEPELVFEYAVRATLHDANSKILAFSPHTCYGKIDITKKALTFERHGKA